MSTEEGMAAYAWPEPLPGFGGLTPDQLLRMTKCMLISTGVAIAAHAAERL